jgi:uncharacterized protein YjbI with pentapeptide repeats
MKSRLATIFKKAWDSKWKIIVGISVPILVLIIFWAIWADISPKWTGFGAFDAESEGPRAKTLWDWMELLLVPIVLALAGWWLTKTEKETEQNIANQRQEKDHALNLEQTRQASLEKYMSTISELILKNALVGPQNKQDDLSKNTKNLVRMWTLVLLRDMNENRKSQMLQFLYESGLINQPESVDLTRANLDLINLWGAYLIGVQLPRVSLKNANLIEATMSDSNLAGSDLTNAELDNAELRDIDLSSETILTGATFRKTELTRANLSNSILVNCNFSEAILIEAKLIRVVATNAIMNNAKLMEVDFSQSDLSNVKMRGADLRRAKLINVNLLSTDFSEADLRGVDFKGAELGGADLSLANLKDAIISDEQLRHVKSLNGATMPDGRQFTNYQSRITPIFDAPKEVGH